MLNLFRQIQSQNRLTLPSSRAEKKQTVMQVERKQTQPKQGPGTCVLRRHIFHCLVFTLTTNSPHRVLAGGQTKHPLSLEKRLQHKRPTEGGSGMQGLPSLDASLCGWGPRPSLRDTCITAVGCIIKARWLITAVAAGRCRGRTQCEASGNEEKKKKKIDRNIIK